MFHINLTGVHNDEICYPATGTCPLPVQGTGAVGLYGVCGSRNSRRFGRRATDAKNGNAGPKLHWRLWGKSGFSALLCDRGHVPKNNTHI